jgi:hypothetical protein
MNDPAPQAPTDNGKPWWLDAVGSVVFVGVAGLVMLPLLALGGMFISSDVVTGPLFRLWKSLFPFMFLLYPGSTVNRPITEFPLVASTLQWLLLVALNVMLVKRGWSKSPFLSALLIAGLCAVLSMLVVLVFGLRFDIVRS